MSSVLRKYLRDIEKILAGGRATEHSYRPTLKAVVEALAPGIEATNEPQREQCGAPDFIVERGGAPIGYLECKDLGVSLDQAEKSEQLRRYRDSMDNLILTDYLEFRYYRGGELRMHALLGRPDERGKIKLLQGQEEQIHALFSAFFDAEARSIGTPKELADRLARIARIIRDAIELALSTENLGGTLHAEMESFRATILNDITPKQFADMYAQTVCYGMFSARVNVPDREANHFTRQHAAYDLPATNPFLREVFEYIAGTKLDTSIVWAVELLAETLKRCDMGEILAHFGRATRREDPVVHFYETFLVAYDPALRERRGVYYTPEPVVGYIVRSIDEILKRDFDCPEGLADHRKIKSKVSVREGDRITLEERDVHRVQILDPATGTGTFLYETVRHIHEALVANRGMWAGEKGYVAEHLLPRLFGFELMMAPYAVAHMKLGWLLKETGYNFPNDERLRVYLTNTLEQAEIIAGPLLALAIAREANAASRVKSESPIMVVLGNPPYSGHSANKGKWSSDLIKQALPLPHGAPGYFECDGKPLGERNPKWLNDDYVKFIRFGQYRIERTGYGILAFITNHGYLDNPTFRGMRQSLMQTFDDIYLVNLHGNAKKKEKTPDGGKDENVFDIMQGVSIGIFVRRKNGERRREAQVHHADLWGVRAAKYKALAEQDVERTQWTRLAPGTPSYLFVPQDQRLAVEYAAGWSLREIMPLSNVGIVTARDALTVHHTGDELWRTVTAFAGMPPEDVRIEFALGKDARDWKVQLAQEDVRDSGPDRKNIVPVLYRPFDRRYTYYTGRTRGFHCMPRPEIMAHMLKGRNLGLVATRQTKEMWDVFVTDSICGHKSCSAYDINSLFPLYYYNGTRKQDESLWDVLDGERRPNLAGDFVRELAERLGLKAIPDGRGDLKKTFGPEDVLHYVYAVFHSPTYRTRYAEFLKLDFPRVPLTGDRKLFARLCGLGAELVGLHLLEAVPSPEAAYPQPGSGEVEKPRFIATTPERPGRVYINAEQYFEGIPPEVWEFRVGGYQVCEKWLKDRKGRTLSYDDIETYRKITEALRQTIRLMAEIDAAIPGWPLS